MNYVQTQQFLAIVKYMNLSKAAKELYISQPALSLALGRLEKELGVRLFYRDGNKLILSPDGEELYSYFKDLRDSYQRLLQKADALKERTEEYIRIAFAGSAMQFAALYMSDFLSNYKGKVIKKIYAPPMLAQDLLLNQQVDFVISYPPLTDEAVSTVNIMREEIILVVSSGHPLAKRDSVSLAELTNEKIYTLDRSHRFRTLVDSICAKNNVSLQYYKELDYEDLYRAIDEHQYADDLLVFMVPNGFEKSCQVGYKQLHITGCTMERVTGLSWLTDKKLNYQYKGLVDHIINGYAEQSMYHAKVQGIYVKNLPVE